MTYQPHRAPSRIVLLRSASDACACNDDAASPSDDGARYSWQSRRTAATTQVATESFASRKSTSSGRREQRLARAPPPNRPPSHEARPNQKGQIAHCRDSPLDTRITRKYSNYTGLLETPRETDNRMKENIRTLRLLHNLLLLTSTAILAFVLSPDESTRIKAALAELAALRELQPTANISFATYVHSQLKTPEDKQNAIIRSALREADIKMFGHPRLFEPFCVDAFPADGSYLIAYEGYFNRAQTV